MVVLWTLLLGFPSLVYSIFAVQQPPQLPTHSDMVTHGTFKFKEGSDFFSPKDLVELSRPGPGVANVPGDLILVPVSKYSFDDKKCVRVFHHQPCACFDMASPLLRVCSGWDILIACPMFAHSKSRGRRDVATRGPRGGRGMYQKHAHFFLFHLTGGRSGVLTIRSISDLAGTTSRSTSHPWKPPSNRSRSRSPTADKHSG